MSSSAGRKPSYWIVLLPLLIGAGTCGGSIYSVSQKVESMPRFKVPGHKRLHLPAGEYVGFLETSSVIDGEAISGNASVNCGMTAADTGEQIPLHALSSSTSYSFGSYEGKSVMSVNIPRSGDYLIRCEGQGTGALAFGKSITWLIVVALVGGLLGALVAGILGWRIRRRRRELDAAAQPA